MTRREEFTAWICAQTGSAYVWGAQGHKVRRDGTVYMNQRKVSDSYESWVRQRENGEENARRAISGIRQRLTEGANEVTCYDCSGLIMAYIRDIKGYTTRDLSARVFKYDRYIHRLYFRFSCVTGSGYKQRICDKRDTLRTGKWENT